MNRGERGVPRNELQSEALRLEIIGAFGAIIPAASIGIEGNHTIAPIALAVCVGMGLTGMVGVLATEAYFKRKENRR